MVHLTLRLSFPASGAIYASNQSPQKRLYSHVYSYFHRLSAGASPSSPVPATARPFNVRESINAKTWPNPDPTQKPYYIPADTRIVYSVRGELTYGYQTNSILIGSWIIGSGNISSRTRSYSCRLTQVPESV
ncbi:hypothetical protein AX14_009149 [Amanita brunnescens Koide BX004]|nr:hypothetical protein AX14_009149 [Amanita brunnescens Koide BX004]